MLNENDINGSESVNPVENIAQPCIKIILHIISLTFMLFHRQSGKKIFNECFWGEIL